MLRCLQLARNGAGSVAPNPMVGCVLVQGDRILAEGWHKAHGGPHAEVECLNAFGDRPLPEDAVLYVDLEPCSHHGRTPPCADLLIARGVRKVVIGQRDPFPQVAGKGIERLRSAGVDVVVGLEEAACRWHQRRFITSIEDQRPYIILKWARSVDGFMDQHPHDPGTIQPITNDASNTMVHRWRTEEQAIMVGSRTAINDDPQLTARHVAGLQPLRVIIDRNSTVPIDSRIFDRNAPTLLFTRMKRSELPHVDQAIVDGDDPLELMLHELDKRSIRSVLVEGGASLLNAFLQRDMWDEARVLTGKVHFGKGTPAPVLPDPQRTMDIDGDRLDLFVNPASHPHVEGSWAW